MSRPRAATSVATRTSRAPSRKRPMIRSRCSCDEAAVERRGVAAAAAERLGEVVHLAARPGEHERRGAVLEVEDAAERGELVGAPDDVGDLPDAGGARPRPASRPGRGPGPGGAGGASASRAIGPAIVAENSAVWRISGSAPRIFSRSSAKPMSSISSASSRTTVSTSSKPDRAALEVVDGAARAWRRRRPRRARAGGAGR